MNYSSSQPTLFNRDRFVLSNGHAVALYYSMLHLAGFDISMDDIKQFRQTSEDGQSKTPGHPENHTPGIEMTTGPLGQGISNAVGLAIGQTHMAAVYNKEEFELFNNYTYVICGDGCLQEGVSSEASSLAGHLKLGRLIVLYDDNLITIDGDTSLSFTENVGARYESYGWQVLTVEDGNAGPDAILAAIEEAKADTERPTLIKVRTTIGFGSGKQGTHGVHGAPLGEDDLAFVKSQFGFDPEERFVVGDAVREVYAAKAAQGLQFAEEQARKLDAYCTAFPEQGAELRRRIAGELPEGWQEALPRFAPGDKTLASRAYSGLVLNALAPLLPELVGGSADLTPSNNTWLKCSHDYQADSRDGRYIRFGVREHGMCAIANGLHAYGMFRPYCATFLTFLGYCIGSVRLSALSHHAVTYVFTHDSIALGEDGPTHQPVETLSQARSLPNLNVIRPADGNETSGAYLSAIGNSHGPTLLALSRQGLPNLSGSSPEGVLKGAYVLQETEGEGAPDITLVATGAEVGLSVAAAALLEGKGRRVRVVSFPCWSLFEATDAEYKATVFPAGVPVLSVEAASAHGWARYAHDSVAMKGYGASGKGADVLKYFGFTPECVARKALKLLKAFGGQPAPALAVLTNTDAVELTEEEAAF